jgi:hypothetical protein
MKERTQHDHAEFDLADDGRDYRVRDRVLNTNVADEIEAWQIARTETLPSAPLG